MMLMMVKTIFCGLRQRFGGERRFGKVTFSSLRDDMKDRNQIHAAA
jgi:hypothetical protein